MTTFVASTLSGRRSPLTDSVSQLMPISPAFLDEIRRELDAYPVGWRPPEHPDASPGFDIASLLRSRGGAPEATPLLSSLVGLRNLIEGLDLDIRSAWLIRLRPGSFQYERRIQSEPAFHIPITTNEGSHLILPGTRIHLDFGHLWKVSPIDASSLSNFGAGERIDIVLNCAIDAVLKKLLDNESLNEKHVAPLPKLTERKRRDLIERSLNLVDSQSPDQAIELILRSFCEIDLRPLSAPDLMLELLSHYEEHAAPRLSIEERIANW